MPGFLRRVRFLFPFLSVWAVGCGASDGSPETGTQTDDYTSNQGTLLRFEFDGETVGAAGLSAKYVARDQINFSIGQLNENSSVGRLQRLELSNVTTTDQGDGTVLVKYHAVLPVSWGEKSKLPTSFEMILPKHVDAAGRDGFLKTYGTTRCFEHSVTASDAWYYYRPTQSGCALAEADVLRTKASVTVATEEMSTGKYPEYHRVWEDNTLRVVTIFGKATEGATSDSDAGISAYGSFLRQLRQALPQPTVTPSDTPMTPGLANPDVTIEADLDGTHRISVVALLVDKMGSVGPSFDQRYDPLSREADLIFYNGHAGLGANVRTISQKGDFERGRYQIFFVNGCDTFAYTDFALMSARQGLNPDDPLGTKYLDVITNSMPAYFSSLADAGLTIIEALKNWKAPKTYEQIFKDFEGKGGLNPLQVIVVTGEEDNVFEPGYVTGEDPCVTATTGNGKYCGKSLSGVDDGILYECWNQHLVLKAVCDEGCQVNPPGKADACQDAAPVVDPCENAIYGDGAYCGGALEGEGDKLYRCVGKVTDPSGSHTCPKGCQLAPPGQADYCLP